VNGRWVMRMGIQRLAGPAAAGVGVLVLALGVGLWSASSAWASVGPVRCHDIHGQPWNWYSLGVDGQPYVQKEDDRYLVEKLGIGCDFARLWARRISLGHRNVTRKGVITDPPRGWTCTQKHSEVFKREAAHEPPIGFDVGPATCRRYVGKRTHRRGISFGWTPLPLSFEPY
jgi:hypothetical protein